MDTLRLEHQIRFILEMDKLKNVLRRSTLTSVDRQENSAEHSWHLALAAVVLVEYADEPVDLEHVIKILLVHDIVEIDAGDTYAYDPRAIIDQSERENSAASRIYGLLPTDQADEFRKLWHEFEARQTPEARFAHAIDRLAPLLLNYYTAGKSWKAHEINQNQVLSRNQSTEAIAKTLWQFAQGLIASAQEKGYFDPTWRK